MGSGREAGWGRERQEGGGREIGWGVGERQDGEWERGRMGEGERGSPLHLSNKIHFSLVLFPPSFLHVEHKAGVPKMLGGGSKTFQQHNTS